jgi:mycoredoxin
MFQRIRIYTTPSCSDCRRAKTFLRNRGIPFEEVDIEEDPGAAEVVLRATGGKHTVPTFDIDGRFVTCSPFRPNILLSELGLES